MEEIQIFSDLHIERWHAVPKLPVLAKYLILAGDICPLHHPHFFPFLSDCSTHWEKVFYVPGNHEYHSDKMNYEMLDAEYHQKICNAFGNVFFLNNESAHLKDDIYVFGSVFWTQPCFSHSTTAREYLGDYQHISYFDPVRRHVVPLSVAFVRDLSDASMEALKTHLTKHSDDQTIVVTHFPPIREAVSLPVSPFQPSVLQNYFSWPQETIHGLPHVSTIRCWISGHTHYSYDLTYEGVRFLSNQLGYKSEVHTSGIKESGLFTV